MRRKVIVAKITQDELDKLIEAQALINTYHALQLNRFVTSEDKIQIYPLLKRAVDAYEFLKINFIEKYDIPYNNQNQLKIDAGNKTLYIEVISNQKV